MSQSAKSLGVGRLAVGLPMYAYRDEDVMEEKKFRFKHLLGETVREMVIDDGRWVLDTVEERRSERRGVINTSFCDGTFGVFSPHAFTLSRQSSAVAETEAFITKTCGRLVHDLPFGAVVYEQTFERTGATRITGRSVVLARQIHKGELWTKGQPDVREWKYTPNFSPVGYAGSGGEFITVEDLWLELDKRYSIEELLRHFGRFSCAGDGKTADLNTVYMLQECGLSSKNNILRGYRFSEMDLLGTDWSCYWVQQRMARAAIALHHFKFDLFKLR
ncbi:MAG: hypothetical protein Q7R83_01545 [bacterium]|nr:hypothetical protein [bacterium]